MYETLEPTNPDRKITVPMMDALSARTDFYKLLMSQLAWEKHPDAEVTFTFHDRGNTPLADYVDPAEIGERFDHIISSGFHDSELEYFASIEDKGNPGQPLFRPAYLDYLRDRKLPKVNVRRDGHTLAIDARGPWSLSTFTETSVMGEVNEMYFYNFMKKEGIDPETVLHDADERTTRKIEQILGRPDFRYMEFGTRRHFSIQHHAHTLGRLATETPNNLIGTSNLFLADYLGLDPKGTTAHEMDMVYVGMAGDDDDALRAAHPQMMDDWMGFYGPWNSAALPDTYGVKYFFDSLGEQRAQEWRSFRHDSGNPMQWGPYVLRRLGALGVDPKDKSTIYSDGLDIDEAFGIEDAFAGPNNPWVGFGIGTYLTNDTPIPALNIVMKATEVDGYKTVKISDYEGKAQGPKAQIERVKRVLGYVPLAQAIHMD